MPAAETTFRLEHERQSVYADMMEMLEGDPWDPEDGGSEQETKWRRLENRYNQLTRMAQHTQNMDDMERAHPGATHGMHMDPDADEARRNAEGAAAIVGVGMNGAPPDERSALSRRQDRFYTSEVDPFFAGGINLTDFEFRQWVDPDDAGRLPSGRQQARIVLNRAFPRMGSLQRDYRDFLDQLGIRHFTERELQEELQQRAPVVNQQTGANPDGGGVAGGTAGQVLSSELLGPSIETAMLDFGAMMNTRMQVITTPTGEPLRIPTVDDTSRRAFIVGQNLDVNDDANYRTGTNRGAVEFDDISLGAHTYSSGTVRIPQQLIRDSHYPVVNYIGARLGERFGRAWSEHDTNGKGPVAGANYRNSQPWGIIPRIRGKDGNNYRQDAHNVKVVVADDTGLTVGTGANQLEYGDLVDVYTKLDPAYRVRGEWMFHSSFLGLLMKMSTGTTGYPIWLPGNIAGRIPATVFGHPYVENTHMADNVADQSTDPDLRILACFGDFSTYMSRNVDGLAMRVLDELYAEYNQIGILGFASHDANYLWAEADSASGGRAGAPFKYMYRATS